MDVGEVQRGQGCERENKVTQNFRVRDDWGDGLVADQSITSAGNIGSDALGPTVSAGR